MLTLTPKAHRMAGTPTGIDWKLLTGAKKLTTRFFSVQITGVGTGLFEMEPPKVRVELRSKGKIGLVAGECLVWLRGSDRRRDAEDRR